MTSEATPAGRLHRMLSELRGMTGNHSVPDAWADVLHIRRGDWPELLRRYSLVLGLPDEIAAQVKAIDPSRIDYELTMLWEPAVRAALDTDFSRGAQLQQLVSRYDGETLANLRWCHEMIRRWYPMSSPVKQSDLDRITEKIRDLEANLEDPDIDPELRDLLITHARAMAQAVRDVPIRGRVGLEAALDQALGDVYLRRPNVAKRDPHCVDKLLAVAQTIMLALQISLTGIQIEQADRPPLPQHLVIRLQTLPARPALPPGESSAPSPAEPEVVDAPQPTGG